LLEFGAISRKKSDDRPPPARRLGRFVGSEHRIKEDWIMRFTGISLRWILSAGAIAAACATAGLLAQAPGSNPQGQIAAIPVGAGQPGAQAAPAQHPLVPALQLAYQGRDAINQNIQDYTCTMIKRERVNGTLGEREYMYAKVRHQPFSVYLNFLKPAEVAGRQVIYVQGVHNDELAAHEGKGIRARLGWVWLKPTSALAMDGQRYPITMLGVSNLTKRLIEVAEHDKQFGECDVQIRKNAKVNDRVCTIIEVTHPVPRRNFIFHKAVVYVDDELHIPIRYEAYSWPKTPGGPPTLDEEYTYVNLKTNVGLQNIDFDTRNAEYNK